MKGHHRQQMLFQTGMAAIEKLVLSTKPGNNPLETEVSIAANRGNLFLTIIYLHTSIVLTTFDCHVFRVFSNIHKFLHY